MEDTKLSNENVAKGIPLSFPLSPEFASGWGTLCFLYPDSAGKRQVFAIDLNNMDSESGTDASINQTPTPYQMTEMFHSTSEKLSLEEQLRRERMRLFTSGIASYEIANGSISTTVKKIIIPMNGMIYLCIVNSDKNATEVNTMSPPTGMYLIYDGLLGRAVDPHLSPDGTCVAFVVNNDLYIQYVYFRYVPTTGLKTFNPIRLTHTNNEPGVSCGLADYLAQEEMDRYRGFWWAPDSKSIVYCRNDERAVPEYNILHQYNDNPFHTERHRYPFAGKENGLTQLFCISIPAISTCRADPKLNEMKFISSFPQQTIMQLMNNMSGRSSVGSSVGSNVYKVVSDYYLARAGFWPDGSVMAQIQTRDQCTLELVRFDPSTGRKLVLVTEESNVWINLHDLLYTFSKSFRPKAFKNYTALHPDDFYFIWASERSGFRQLYLYYYDSVTQTADVLRKIGPEGSYVVDSICAVDEENEYVYFQSSYESPLTQHLYRTSFSMVADDGRTAFPIDMKQITQESGWHNVTVNVKLGYYFDIFSSTTQPYITKLCSLNNEKQQFVIYDTAKSPALEALQHNLQLPSFKTIRTDDNNEDLHCAAYIPDKKVYGEGPFPCVVSVYGGPHVQRVYNQWSVTADLRAQKLAQNGYIVIKCDNRGSYRRGSKFEGAIKFDMGNIEIMDQVTAVKSYGDLVDMSRVGMFGWSYGGYMSAMAVCRAPQVFKCAVAGAPVTFWEGYDTHYTG